MKETEMRTVAQTADMLGYSVATLEKWRSYGVGPAYEKLGKLYLYKLEDIRLWLVAHPGGKLTAVDRETMRLHSQSVADRKARKTATPELLPVEQVVIPPEESDVDAPRNGSGVETRLEELAETARKLMETIGELTREIRAA